MKIAFVYRGAENLGIEYISSLLKSKGHKVYLFFDPAIFSGDLINIKIFSHMFDIDNKIINGIIDLKPDLLAFSAYTGNYRWCLNIAQRVKNKTNIPIVFGGVHTTAVPERVLSNDFIDFAVTGEGEYAMLDLVEVLERGAGAADLVDTPNICFNFGGTLHLNAPRSYIKDLDSLPFPDKLLFYEKVPLFEEKYSIATSRGCPYKCTYCSNDMYHEMYSSEKKHVRRRSPDNVIEELLYFKKRGRMKLVSFEDDVFTFSRKWLEEFIEKYKSKINLPFFCSVHPATISREIANLLKEGGCFLTTMGVQSGSPRIRKEVFERYDSNETIIKAISYIKDAGIKISVDNIFGAPSETEQELAEGFDFYKKAKADRILTFWLAYFPKTSIIKQATEHNYITEKDIINIEEGYIGSISETGSVSEKMVSLYSGYEILFQLRSLVHNDKVYDFLSGIILYVPIRKLVKKIIFVLIAIKNRDLNVFYRVKYLFSKKNTP